MRQQLGLGVLAVLACGCATERPDGDPFGGTDGLGDGVGAQADGDDDDDGATSSTGGDADGDGDDDGGDGLKLDVQGAMDLPGSDCLEGEDCGGCTGVDILFVIDNSGSMGDYQAALAVAFPQFAQTLAEALPPGTNVHVGVTSTEMGYSSMGSTSITNGSCSFIGDGDQTNDAFYVTPDASDSGRNGAQGRLYDPGDGVTYYAFDTDDVDLSGVEQWFAGAANIGTGGSNIEMSTAPVAWVADAANAATNDGFIRDEGAVLVVFFMQDEPDQTPGTIDGQSGGAFALERVAAAKAGCGGTDCVIAGGFLASNACSADGDLPLDEFLGGVGSAPIVAQLPFIAPDPATTAAEMNETLSTTLTEIIASTCDEIPPAG